ncbi:MAG: CapA family protein [Bdellovibrionales bacterium]|nr:CapA family protein [Bdellovibrionales bacterium]
MKKHPLFMILLISLLTPDCPIWAAAPAVDEIVIGMGGDVSLSRTGVTEVNPRGATYGRFYTWEEMTAGLKPLTSDNDFNFLNMESVVTDRRDLTTDQKFSQRSHPAGLEYLVRERGFNLISLANNHATDFGQEGLNESYKNLRRIEKQLPFSFSGIGSVRETTTPEIINYKGIRIAFAAMGMKGDGREDRGRPTENSIGMLSVRRCANGQNETAGSPCADYSDYRKVLENLRDAPADFRILSLHEGTELAAYVNPKNPPEDSRQRRENRRVIMKFDMAEAYGVDLIIGHHSHNVRAVRWQNNKLSFFGLGNFLFLGGQNYMDKPLWNRYGLFAKVYLSVVKNSQGHRQIKLSAVEVIPLKNMHVNPSPWGSNVGSQFISHLNSLGQQDFGSTGLQFADSGQGSGLFCVPQVPRGPRSQIICR